MSSERAAALLLALGLAACGGRQAPAAPVGAVPPVAPLPTLTPAQIAERAMPAVVLIKSESMLGTGFFVWEDGRIATNLHVIADARQVTVVLSDGRETNEVEVLAVDRQHDLAVLRIRIKPVPVLPLGDATIVKPGERVVAIGHPLGLGNTVSDGLVSAVRVLDSKTTLLQISAPIAPGSSGGPLLNDHGEVIGVATLYTAEGQNLNFGVPVTYLKPLLLAEKGTPLAVFNVQASLGILEGCTVDEVKLAVTAIGEAIQIGAPLFNQGDAARCYAVYEQAALSVLAKIKGCAGVRETLLGGLSAANRTGDVVGRAWALRHAFDRILEAFNAAVDQVRSQP